MIIITGPGRSGTSVVARLYKELGFDPGGKWDPTVNAGFEASEVVEVNDAIKKDLGVETLLGTGAGLRYRFPKLYKFGKLIQPLLPKNLTEIGLSTLMGARKDVQLVQWEKMDMLVQKYRPLLHNIAALHKAVKDPQFCWTLMVWAAAKVPIEHVLICVRSLDSIVQSRFSAGQLKTRSASKAKNSLAYGMGLCMAAVYSYKLPYAIVRFPDFLKQPSELYKKMVFPTPVEYEHFLRVFNQVIDLDKVHEKQWRA